MIKFDFVYWVDIPFLIIAFLLLGSFYWTIPRPWPTIFLTCVPPFAVFWLFVHLVNFWINVHTNP